MTFRHRRMQLFCALTALIAVIAFSAIQTINTSTAHAATNQFHGVNWADPNDNFGTGNLVPVGLSTSDNYATTYAKATAILKGFQALGANTVRMPFNAATVSGSWWGSYTAAWDAASALGMNVVVAPWLQNGTIGDTTTFYNMWNVVINKYSGNSHFYFDIMNEPWGYSATDEDNVAASWVAHYSSLPKGHILVPGAWSDQNLCTVGADSRLVGTLLSIHDYTLGGETHPTEAAWITSINNNICGYASRAVFTEFGVPMNTGVNYDGPRDGTNNVSYLYAITDNARNLGMGTIIWVGVKQANQTQGPGPCFNASCAITSLNGSGTNLSLSINNQSGLDRLQYAWGGVPPTPTPTSVPTATPTPKPTATPTPKPTVTPTPGTPTPTATPSPGATCAVSYVVQNQWPTGFTASITIKNTGTTTLNGWTLKFSFSNGQQVQQGWNGNWTQSGTSVTVTNAPWNGSLAPNASVAPGFNASWSGSNSTPTSFTLNGATCSAS